MQLPVLVPVGLVLLASLAAGQVAPDPFAPGLRWERAADPAEPWIPRGVALVGDGELVLAAPAVGRPGLELLAASTDPGVAPTPVAAADLGGALGEVGVLAGPRADALYALAQFPDPTPSLRRSELRRYDAEAGGPTLALSWSRVLGSPGNGPARLAGSRDATRLFGAVLDATTGALTVARLDPASGMVLFERALAGDGLRALAGSADGARLALSTATAVHVLEGERGDPLLVRAVPGGTGPLALSADGRTLVHQRSGGLDVLVDGGSGYAPAGTIDAGPDEVATVLALGDAGATLAVGWWNAVDGRSVRVQVLDLASGAVLAESIQAPGAGGLQNLPATLAITPDGRRAAFGLWGAADARPEVLLLERGRSTPVLALDLAGSPTALALTADGTRLAVAAKDAHANLFATTGRVALHETGERDLALLGTPRLGSTVELVLALEEAGSAVFCLGAPRSSGLATRWGALGIDLAAPHAFLPGTVEPGGTRATATVRVAPDPALAGSRLAVQGAELSEAGVRLSRHVLRPLVL